MRETSSRVKRSDPTIAGGTEELVDLYELTLTTVDRLDTGGGVNIHEVIQEVAPQAATLGDLCEVIHDLLSSGRLEEATETRVRTTGGGS